MKDFIVIPTYNERENINPLIRKIFSLYPEIYIVVVDDNSPDKTADAVRTLQREFKQLLLRERSGKLGLASAYMQTFHWILETYDDARAIITMDADLSHDPIVVKTMLEKIHDYDLVIGSRYTKGGGVENWELHRQILSRGGNFYARVISGLPIRDLTAGFLCFRASLLRHERFKSINANGFAFLMELKMFAHSLDARITEVPIIFKNRVEGVSKISNHIIYEGLIVPWILRMQLIRYKRKQ